MLADPLMLVTHRLNHGVMFNLVLTPEDKSWLTKEHPSLNVGGESDEIVISGSLKFDMVYERDSNRFIVSPVSYRGDGYRIKDQYEVKILLQPSNISELPQVFETASRITSFAKECNLPLYDFHVNGDGSVCLCVAGRDQEYFLNGFEFKLFVNQLVIPFFYAQTYYQKYRKWPWGEYAHGILGLFERYNEKPAVTKGEFEKILNRIQLVSGWAILAPKFRGENWIKGHTICLCGKNEKIRKCHSNALAGMRKLKNDLLKYRIKV
ncbi:MAG: hypothetical protein ACD_61C00274G0001 [uncultured bacterium]|nr:MAG: hypothetical protein ACD_61C00274G0001 [uncultured bacterium]